MRWKEGENGFLLGEVDGEAFDWSLCREKMLMLKEEWKM